MKWNATSVAAAGDGLDVFWTGAVVSQGSEDALNRIELIWSKFVAQVVVSHIRPALNSQKTLYDKESNSLPISNEMRQILLVSLRTVVHRYEA